MIKLQKYTPEIYYKESRDFQFIGRLYDLVLNAVKTDIDLLYYLPVSVNSDEKLLELLSLTFGFKPKRQYNARQLKAVCSVLSEIIRNKGSIKALKIACEALFNAMDIEQELNYDFTAGKDKTELNLYISEEFEDINILYDLLNYVLPAGITCNIIKELHISSSSHTELGITNTVSFGSIDNNSFAQMPRLSSTENTNIATGILSTSDAIKALIEEKENDTLKTKPGFSINSEIIKLEETKKNG